MSWLSKLKGGLSKTANNIKSEVTRVFTAKKIDESILDDLHATLIASDLGVSIADELIDIIRKHKSSAESPEDEVKSILIQKLESYFEGLQKPIVLSNKPHVIMLVGVNGNGKTTTAGKIAQKLYEQGNKVFIAACDTFRAAAVEQLEVWANRANATLIKGVENADPASVAYSAYQRALEEGADALIIDTAGRLHNKTNLMEELGKISKVLKKLNADLPHDCVLVLDATTGQNALMQVEAFKNFSDINGIVMTKLDGTAKGGILVNIANKFKIPIRAVGVGEGVDDLDYFDVRVYSESFFK